jgi:phosphoribosylamine--glycine ligase
MAGLVPRTGDWRAELSWVREAGQEGLVIFEGVGSGVLQDELRADCFNVIGGSGFGDRLECERGFAQRLLAKAGLNVAPIAEFESPEAAITDLRQRPRRCVFKVNASEGDTFVGSSCDGSDIAALLKTRLSRPRERFILMDHVAGIETGVGAYFNGTAFLRPACLDWEHKRFFAGDMGELTGEMGTVATFEGSDALFDAVLAPLEAKFQEAGHVGYVNLNTIINEEGVWPLEFTCRFGYPGFAVLEPLQDLCWSKLFQEMVSRKTVTFPALPGFCLCVVLTTPPFPWSRKQVDSPVGLPVTIAGDAQGLHLGEVGISEDQLVTTGLYGWTAVATGTGMTISEAKAAAYANAARLNAPNLRYRLDIGDTLNSRTLEYLADWGWLDSMPADRIPLR